MKSFFDQQNEKLDEVMERTRETKQCLTRLEQDARQPRFSTETDVTSDKETCERTEDAAADRVINEDSSSVQVDPDPMCLTSFTPPDLRLSLVPGMTSW